ncbi:hypothetical protein [Streptomyces europaeiscabiei]|uniref:hypothetical protein n=1 Tax=Streptomyces europaeiscabiei TaxID=146819 RepID=UPI0038F72E11
MYESRPGATIRSVGAAPGVNPETLRNRVRAAERVVRSDGRLLPQRPAVTAVPLGVRPVHRASPLVGFWVADQVVVSYAVAVSEMTSPRRVKLPLPHAVG